MMDFYKKNIKGNKKIIEPSRFFMLPSEGSLNVLKMVELGAIAVGLYVYKNDYGITCCTNKMGRFHKRFGFIEIRGTYAEEIAGIEVNCLLLSKCQIPNEYKTEIQEMETAFLMTDQICFGSGVETSYFSPSHRAPVYFRGIYDQVA